MFKIEDPQSFLQKILRNLHDTITKDPICEKMEEALAGFIPAERNRPRKFGDVEVWLESKRYKRLDVYQGGVEHFYDNFKNIENSNRTYRIKR